MSGKLNAASSPGPTVSFRRLRRIEFEPAESALEVRRGGGPAAAGAPSVALVGADCSGCAEFRAATVLRREDPHARPIELRALTSHQVLGSGCTAIACGAHCAGWTRSSPDLSNLLDRGHAARDAERRNGQTASERSAGVPSRSPCSGRRTCGAAHKMRVLQHKLAGSPRPKTRFNRQWLPGSYRRRSPQT